MSFELTREECLLHFRSYCQKGVNLDAIQRRVENGECPFLDYDFEKDQQFRGARRHYRRNFNSGVKEEFLKIIEEERKK